MIIIVFVFFTCFSKSMNIFFYVNECNRKISFNGLIALVGLRVTRQGFKALNHILIILLL